MLQNNTTVIEYLDFEKSDITHSGNNLVVTTKLLFV